MKGIAEPMITRVMAAKMTNVLMLLMSSSHGEHVNVKRHPNMLITETPAIISTTMSGYASIRYPMATSPEAPNPTPINRKPKYVAP